MGNSSLRKSEPFGQSGALVTLHCGHHWPDKIRNRPHPRVWLRSGDDDDGDGDDDDDDDDPTLAFDCGETSRESARQTSVC